MHAESLKPDWYKYELPTTLGHPGNYTLTADEVERYVGVLYKMHALLARQTQDAKATLKAMRTKHVPPWDHIPHPLTLGALLENEVRHQRTRLEMTEFMVDVTGRRVQAKREREA